MIQGQLYDVCKRRRRNKHPYCACVRRMFKGKQQGCGGSPDYRRIGTHTRSQEKDSSKEIIKLIKLLTDYCYMQ